jgi:hypothetical protein
MSSVIQKKKNKAQQQASKHTLHDVHIILGIFYKRTNREAACLVFTQLQCSNASANAERQKSRNIRWFDKSTKNSSYQIKTSHRLEPKASDLRRHSSDTTRSMELLDKLQGARSRRAHRENLQPRMYKSALMAWP